MVWRKRVTWTGRGVPPLAHRLLSSQVSSISPELASRWDKVRRFDVAWQALRRLQPEKWITQRFPSERADEAYRLLDESPQETIQVLFEYNP
jgi:threonine dehydrogenase-like Zn-dependent dehydrogenase